MEKITFSAADPNGLEIVRSVIFQKLKARQWNQIPNNYEYFKDCVELVGDEWTVKDRFLVLVNEIFWQLIIQGVISPGLNAANPNLPHFHITDYGMKVLEEEKFIPHDPTDYLNKFSSTVVNPDPIVLAYLTESLRCFTTGSFLASTMMLGIASERIFIDLCDVLLNSLVNETEKQQFQKICESISMISKFTWVQDKIESIMKKNRSALPKNTKTALLGIFDFIRIQRNDIGHPQDNLQIPSRDDVYVNLRLFPQYCSTVKGVEEYISKNKV